MTSNPKISFINQVSPVLFLALLIIYGMVLRPNFFQQSSFPLEVVFMLAAVFAVGELLVLGFIELL